MKRFVTIILSALLALSLFCSCDTPPSPNDVTMPVEDSEKASLLSLFYGEWTSESGEKELIDESGIGGSPYSVLNVTQDGAYNITALFSIGGASYTYKLYRYYVGYAEYSYMEVTLPSKDVMIKFSK